MEHDAYENMSQLQAQHWWYRGRRAVLTELLRRMGPPRNAEIVEIGCGPGGNLAMLAGFGRVSAVEPYDRAREWALALGKYDIRDGLLPDQLPFAPASFDLAAALDVIEHLDDDAGALRAIHDLVKPGGQALFTVPAYQFLWSHHDVINHHKRRYTLGRFRALVAAAGFEILDSNYYNFFLFPIAASVRLTKKALGIEEREDVMPGALANRALTAIFAAERFLAPHLPLPFGVSIYVAARRPASPA